MDTLQFSQEIVTPEGTPLGGQVFVEVHSNGDWHAHFEMHSSSSLASFDYGLRAYLTAPGCPAIAFIHSGHVDTHASDVHDENGNNQLIALYWARLESGPAFTASKSYQWSGAIGALADIVDDIVVVFAGAVGAALGVVIGATDEALKAIGVSLGPGGTFGVIGGVMVFAIAAFSGVGLGGALIAGAVTALVVCAIADHAISSRPLNDAEKQLARQVFGDTAPLDQVMLTNIGGASHRNFTAQGVDNKIYVNLGAAYSDPLAPGGTAYPYPGQVLIHELTHAWQISHRNFLPGLMCSMLVTQAEFTLGDDVYAYGAPGQDWGRFNPEQQAAIVDQWFGGNGNSIGYRPMDQQNTYYRYVWENLLQRVPPPTAPANLRACTASPVASVHLNLPGQPDEVDVFWAGSDGSVANRASTGSSWEGTDVPPFAAAGFTTAGASLAAVTRQPGVLNLLGAGPDAAVNDQVTGGIATQGRSQVAPAPAARADSALAAVARISDGLDAFWIGPDGSIMTSNWYVNQGPDWASHPPVAITAPGAAQAGSGLAAVARTPYHLDLFWVGADGAIWTTWWDGQVPNPTFTGHAFTITGPGAARLGSPVSCVARTPDTLDVFWIGPGGSIMTQYWNSDPAANWDKHAPFPVTGPGAAQRGTGLAAVSRVPIQLDLFWAAPDGAIMSQYWADRPGLSWADHSPFRVTNPVVAHTGTPVSAVSRIPSRIDVFWKGTDGAAWTTWGDTQAPNGAWDQHELQRISPPGAVGYDWAGASTAASAALAQATAAATAGKAADAVDATQRAVGILEQATVAPGDQPAYLNTLIETQYDLVTRLLDNKQAADAAAQVPAMADALAACTALPGADVVRAAYFLGSASDLLSLPRSGQPAASMAAAQAVVTALAAPAPAGADPAAYLLDRAEAIEALISRLIDNKQAADAGAQVPAMAVAFKDYLTAPGASPQKAAQELTSVSDLLSINRAGQPAASLAAQQAAVDVLSGLASVPAGADPAGFRLAQAEVREVLISRLIDNQQAADAAAQAPAAVAAFQDYLAAPGADRQKAANELSSIAGQLTAAGQPAAAQAAQQAAKDAAGG